MLTSSALRLGGACSQGGETSTDETSYCLLSASERRRFDAGIAVTRFEDLSGTNLCASYHPPGYVGGRMLGTKFELLDGVLPFDEPERTADRLAQDSYLIRRGAEVA